MDDFDLEAAAPPGGRSESERAIDLAYKAAARRERTVAELRTCLERRVGPRAIDDAVAELIESGFLDDARYARQFAEDKRELEQWGSERIAQDLRRRGIAPDLIEAALCDSSHDTELNTALMLLEQRFPRLPPTTASAIVPGACSCAAATRPKSPTTPCAPWGDVPRRPDHDPDSRPGSALRRLRAGSPRVTLM